MVLWVIKGVTDMGYVKLKGCLMGEARQRSKSRAQILASASRCVYCESMLANTIEHMPPRGVFKGRDRPSGWEFPCCERCNNGSRGADAVGQLMALIEPVSEKSWKGPQLKKILHAVQRFAPSVAAELDLKDKARPTFVNRNGLLHPAMKFRADGPATSAHLNVFAAKMAMASFSTYIGRPIEMDGLIYTQWFLNQGVPQNVYHATLSIMPEFGQLEQGRKVSGKQFSLNYNTDLKSIIAALVSFHECLTMIIIATDGEALIGPLSKSLVKIVGLDRPGSQMTLPGLPDLESLPGF